MNCCCCYLDSLCFPLLTDVPQAHLAIQGAGGNALLLFCTTDTRDLVSWRASPPEHQGNAGLDERHFIPENLVKGRPAK